MKKVLFSFFLFTVMAVGVNAQKSSCSKSCTAKPASASACESKSSSAASATASTDGAAQLASMDASIETRTCPATGAVSYVKKESSKKGEVSYVDVSYDATTNTFVNVSPSKMEGGAGCAPKNTSGGDKSCCSAKTASGTSAACCSGKGKSTTAKTTSSEGAVVKPVTPSKG